MEEKIGIRIAKTLAAALALALAGVSIGALVAVPDEVIAQEESETKTDEAPAFTRPIRDALQGLVDDGVITPEQADAVAETLAERKPGFRSLGGPGLLTRVAESIGMDPEDLVTALEGGDTIAEVASANGVDPQVVIDELVTAQNEWIAAAVEAGRLSEERAEELRAQSTEQAEALVSGELKLRFGHGGRHGPGGVPPTDETDGEDA
jgi:transposase-like protein